MIHKIKLYRKQVVPKEQIFYALNNAKQSYDYVKIVFWNKTYVSIFFTRDRQVDVATDIRDMQLWNEIKYARQVPITNMKLSELLFSWINKYNK